VSVADSNMTNSSILYYFRCFLQHQCVTGKKISQFNVSMYKFQKKWLIFQNLCAFRCLRVMCAVDLLLEYFDGEKEH